LADLKTKLDEARKKLDDAEAELKAAVTDPLDPYEKDLARAEDALKALTGTFDRFAKLAAEKRWKTGDTVRNLPILHALASPPTPPRRRRASPRSSSTTCPSTTTSRKSPATTAAPPVTSALTARATTTTPSWPWATRSASSASTTGSRTPAPCSRSGPKAARS